MYLINIRPVVCRDRVPKRKGRTVPHTSPPLPSLGWVGGRMGSLGGDVLLLEYFFSGCM